MIDDQTDGSGSIYSFGETNLAAERLRVVSEVFDRTSEAFVSETVRNRPALALDLGCGPGLATSRWDADLWIEVNRTAEVRPSTGQAARMFSMNLSNLRHDPYVKASYPPDQLERLASELDGITGFAETGRIVWQMRQIALRRHSAP